MTGSGVTPPAVVDGDDATDAGDGEVVAATAGGGGADGRTAKPEPETAPAWLFCIIDLSMAARPTGFFGATAAGGATPAGGAPATLGAEAVTGDAATDPLRSDVVVIVGEGVVLGLIVNGRTAVGDADTAADVAAVAVGAATGAAAAAAAASSAFFFASAAANRAPRPRPVIFRPD